MKYALSALSLLVVGCSSGGGSAPMPIPSQSSPVVMSSAAPVASASPAPTSTPTAAPTVVPLALRVMAGAPLSATASQLSTAHRSAQAHIQAQGVANGLPILVESSGMVAAWAGDQTVWVSNAQTSADIAETGGTITPSGTLPLNNPGFSALSCLGSISAVCAVHPMGWEFGTSSANGKPVGKQTLTIAFADGTTGTTVDDVYDGWNLPCNAGWVYQGGVPVATTTRAVSDVYADCVNGNIDFPMGGLVWAQPTADQYGNDATVMPNLTAEPVIAVLNGVVPMTAIPQGIVFAIQTQDGGFAKVYFTSGAGVAVNATNGMSLHSQPNGTFAF